ncbi:MAG: alanine racemase [Alphaproteobacteria bacterium]
MSAAVTDAGRSTGTVLTIDLDAIARNYRLLQSRAPNAVCAAVVKADAYGLGARQVAPVLADAGCGIFFVAHLGEALDLRPLLPDAKICVFNGVAPGAEGDFIENALIPVLNSLEAVENWAKSARATDRLSALLHYDTGMSRLGLSEPELEHIADDPGLLSGLEIGWFMSHLAVADEPEHPLNRKQLERFAAARQRLPAMKASLANSSGIFLGNDYHFDLLRPGAALYGVNPLPGRNNPMEPVVGLQAPILQLRRIDSPASVGYGATYTATNQTLIATIAVGYADGYLRSLSHRGRCYVGRYELPVVGRVSMDLLTLDASALPDKLAQPGTLVEVIGEHHDVDAVAGDAGSIAYEILTGLGARYTRNYIGANAADGAG